MSIKDPNLDAAFDMGTRSLVTAILESRRAYQLAMALAERLLGEQVTMTAEWNDDALPANDAEPPLLALVRQTKRPRPASHRHSVRHRSFHSGLRLVSSTALDSPSVGPTGTRYPSTGARTDEHPDDQRQLDGAKG